ncbi:MAG TPA: hypothetical protein VM888_10865 [Chitinophagaceae bacterium]|nr:hypothetical protein [Chitinophagaceae bacterium]
MSLDPKDPRERKDLDGTNYEVMPDQTPRREGGEDSVERISPTDSRADEKVIVNEQREHKIVNAPSQTADNSSEETGREDDVL